MIRTDSRPFRALATVLVVALVNLSVPVAAIAALTPPEPPKPKAPPKAPPVRSRVLTAKEMRSAQGRSGENPYLAGQNKWDVVYNGVNLMTGNYTQTATDLSFEGGYGIPVNVTRSYSSNNAEESPLGRGWSISVDVRTTAGGVIKSSGAPIMSVPTTFKEQPTGEDTPLATEPVKAVVATDAGGQEETVQEDVDGVLTTPPWDHNVIDSTYDHVNVGGNIYDVLLTNTVKTLDGTIYVYSKHGAYVGGMVGRSGGASGEPGYVLKVDSVTDRQGNVTTYAYSSSSPASFDKSNGTTSEDRLTSISMPNGHQITFAWANNASTGYRSRIVTAKDNGNVRTVTYGYDANGMLASVTTPGGKTTTYGYGGAAAPSEWEEGVPSTLLNSITDPRGFQTQVFYQMGYIKLMPYSVTIPAPIAYEVRSGVRTGAVPRLFVMHPIPWALSGPEPTPPVPDPGTTWTNAVWFGEWAETTGTMINTGSVDFAAGADMIETHGSQSGGGTGTGPHGDSDCWVKYYDPLTYDLVKEIHSIQSAPINPVGTNLAAARLFPSPSWQLQAVTTTSEYNFMGKPLTQKTVEGTYQPIHGAVISESPEKVVEYAYWGADKYFQQKAVVDPSGRISYTDYYPSTAAAGSRGQTLAVYNNKRGNFPALADGWRGTLVPGSGAVAEAIFYLPGTLDATPPTSGYDTKGRCIDVWKLNRPGTAYIRTHTVYGSNTDGSWGQAASVTEDSGGTNRINRLTQTLHYTSWGKADQVRDAANREFTTVYDLDGQVQSVSRTDVTPSVPLATYTYGGTSGTVEYGQPTQVVDGLSGVTQSVSYVQPGTSTTPNYSVGGVASTSQSGGNADAYSVTYSYWDTGDRRAATYATPDGTTTWGYGDYIRVGDPTSSTRVFQTLVKLDGSGVGTAEEIHYAYDSAGRLMHSAFAQNPQTGTGAPTAYPFYTAAKPAQTRARASYDYDPAGRVLGVSHYWDTLSGTAYSQSAILKNECAYDAVKGLKTSSAYYQGSAGSWPSTATTSESYTYDADLDYLTGESDTLGGTTTSKTWTYDAAGNRKNTGYTYNNLNMMTASPSKTYTNDTLGNRLTETTSGNTTTYTWDVLNRMVSRTGTTSATTSSYEYRVDGMRTWKRVGTSVSGYSYELSRHDGQMPMEVEKISTSNAVEATRNVMGTRGVDAEEYISGTLSGTTRTLGTATIAYPLYDAHGNRVAKVWRNGTGGWTGDTPRYYDAWGNVRSGSTTGGSPMRYCASLGHLQDDESGLVYMRARYYEPNTGRFISEDPSSNGSNWYLYGSSDPVNHVDRTGRFNEWSFATVVAGGMLFSAGILAMVIGLFAAMDAITPAQLRNAALIASAGVTASAFGANMMDSVSTSHSAELSNATGLTALIAGGMIGSIAFTNAMAAVTGAALGSKTPARNAVFAVALYSLIVTSFILSIDYE